jgi:hypothetical protein
MFSRRNHTLVLYDSEFREDEQGQNESVETLERVFPDPAGIFIPRRLIFTPIFMPFPVRYPRMLPLPFFRFAFPRGDRSGV